MAALSSNQTDDSERRVAPRMRTLKRAQILFNNRFSTIDCILRNISATGALLTVDPSVPLPKSFEIRLGEDEATRPAKLVYRREMFAGIHFLDVQEEEPAAALMPAAPEPVPPACDDDLRIVPKPLPASIALNLPWLAAR